MALNNAYDEIPSAKCIAPAPNSVLSSKFLVLAACWHVGIYTMRISKETSPKGAFPPHPNFRFCVMYLNKLHLPPPSTSKQIFQSHPHVLPPLNHNLSH